MKSRIIVALFLLKNVYGLVGGKNVSIQAPFQANYADTCGAVIIHIRWVLTTAHCGADGTFIRVGSIHRLTGSKIQIHRHVIHPKYTEGQFDYDIQLLKLYKELRLWRRLRSVKICEEDCGENMTVFGWGYGKEKGHYSDYLQMIQVNRVSIDECQEIPKLLHHEVELTSRMFCAKGIDQDACQGDSGGAVVSSSSGLLVGLASFGYGCGRGHPGVYVSVTENCIRNWIKMYSGA